MNASSPSSAAMRTPDGGDGAGRLPGAMVGPSYHDSTDIADRTSAMGRRIRISPKMPTIAAMPYKYHIGQPLRLPASTS